MDRTCAITRKSFIVTDDALTFLERVSPVFNGKKEFIPLPTLCPEARQQRRLMFRNERTFYHRTCSRCERKIIALYPTDAAFPVYCEQCYRSDAWDACTYGIPFDPCRSFFAQFALLQRTVPHLFFSSANSENSEYCNHVEAMKDCYLVHGSMHSQDCYHGARYFRCSDCVDCLFVNDCELCYEAVNCDNCYDVAYAFHCQDCRSSRRIRHCHGCDNLLFCVNRRQVRNQILNVQYSEKDFLRLRKEILSSSVQLAKHIEKYRTLLLASPEPSRIADQTEGSSGNYLRQCKDCRSCFDVRNCQDVTYGYDGASMNDSRDIYSVYGPGELCYELYSASIAVHHTLFSHDCWPCEALLYCDHCFGCRNCFGCLGLTKKEYCILNTQYTKQEYEKLVPEIINWMRRIGEFGEFFPAQCSPFAYNETSAQEYFPMTKEEVRRRGWRWRDQKDERVTVIRTIPASQVPASIDATPDDILNWAVECEITKRPFRIIKRELEFYRKMRVPVPKLHPDERHRRRMAMRNPRRLWERECVKCGKAIATSYAPKRAEKVVCEECYLKEVY